MATARLAASITVGALLLPAMAVVSRALTGPEGWSALEPDRLLRLGGTTLGVALGGIAVALTVGLLGAWVTTRRTFPGRRIALLLLLSPLGVPPYLVAQFWMETTGPMGPLQPWLGGALFGETAAAAAVIGLSMSPLTMTILRDALARLDRRYEDAAAALGKSPRTRLFEVVLPLLRPALAAGAALVGMYACADFGVVSTLGVPTFTREIFFQLELQFDRDAARSATAALSMVLLAVALPFFALERWGRGAARFEGGEPTPATRLSTLGTVAAWTGVALVVGPTVGLVIGRTLWLIEPGRERLWKRAAEAAGTSALWAAIAATVAVAAAVLIAWTARRRDAPILVPLGSVGFVLPGPVVALGALLVVTAMPWSRVALYGTAAVLITAWVVRALPEALQAIDAGLQQVPVDLEEAARVLGRGPSAAVATVTLPLLRRPVATAWILVFAASARELPASLLLRPLGTRTLPTEVWSFAQDSYYADMAPAALALLCVTAPATALVLAAAGRK